MNDSILLTILLSEKTKITFNIGSFVDVMHFIYEIYEALS